MNPRNPGDPPPPTTSVTSSKRWRFVSLIALILLGAIAVIFFVPRSVLVQRYEGFGIAICVIACGGLLIRHVLRMFAEQDKLEEEQFNADQATVSHSEPNPDGRHTNPTASPPEAGENKSIP